METLIGFALGVIVYVMCDATWRPEAYRRFWETCPPVLDDEKDAREGRGVPGDWNYRKTKAWKPGKGPEHVSSDN